MADNDNEKTKVNSPQTYAPGREKPESDAKPHESDNKKTAPGGAKAPDGAKGNEHKNAEAKTFEGGNPEATDSKPGADKPTEMPREKFLELELREARLELEIKGLKIEEANQKIEKAKQVVESANRHMTRLTAEFDNYRRRTEENNRKLKEDGIIEAVKKLIAVYDTVGIAIGMTCDEETKKGMRMVLAKFKEGLYNLGVSEIESEGCTFDPNYHDAVCSELAPEGIEPGTVTEVISEGFVINGRVLRPAVVKIAK